MNSFSRTPQWNISRWLTSLFIVITVIASLGFVKYQQIQAAIAFGESFPEPSASVQSALSDTMPYAKSIKVVGQLRSTQELVVSSEYAGEITYIGFGAGDRVNKEQVLMRIDTATEEADLKAAKSRLKLAELTYARVKKLLKEKRVSEDQVDGAEADIAIAKAEVKNLEIIIDKKTIKAPFAGQVGLNEFQRGELLTANSEITTLIGIGGDIWVDFAIPQTLLQPSIGNSIAVEAVARSSSGTIGRLEAKVIAKAPFIDVNSRQQSYRAVLNNEARLLHHNQLVSVYVAEPEMQVVTVPTNAIKRNHFGDFVYRLEKDEQQNWRAKPVKVELGERVHDQQIILSGLQQGEFIATEGAFKLQENLLVYTQSDENEAEQMGAGQMGGNK